MNIVRFDNIPYKYEFLWRPNKDKVILDSNGKPLPFPYHKNKKWKQQDLFIQQLEKTQRNLEQKDKFKSYKEKDYKDCLLCNEKNIVTGLFSVNNIRWENSMIHYIKKHNMKPSDEFIDFIYRYNNAMAGESRVIAKINGINIVKSPKKRYLKIDRNQMLIMDALMEHGGKRVYNLGENKKAYKYSEHAGLLDFNNSGLEKIIVSANTNRVDKDDRTIFLPKDLPESFDYEYIFHTHPPTPKPGGRAKEFGLIYEFPSISDIFHFMDHYNKGRVQGSIVIAPEGLYVIRKSETDDKPIIINEDNFYRDTQKIMNKCWEESMEEYGDSFTTQTFYSKIAQDKSYINSINEIINQYKIHIDYFPRIKGPNNKWIIDSIRLPVYSIELEK